VRAQLKNAEEVKAQAEKALVELKARLELAVNNRINRDSSCEDVWAKYPKIKEEVYAELENHEWFKASGFLCHADAIPMLSGRSFGNPGCC
jgi:hypothetical protein